MLFDEYFSIKTEPIFPKASVQVIDVLRCGISIGGTSNVVSNRFSRLSSQGDCKVLKHFTKCGIGLGG